MIGILGCAKTLLRPIALNRHLRWFLQFFTSFLFFSWVSMCPFFHGMHCIQSPGFISFVVYPDQTHLRFYGARNGNYITDLQAFVTWTGIRTSERSSSLTVHLGYGARFDGTSHSMNANAVCSTRFFLSLIQERFLSFLGKELTAFPNPKGCAPGSELCLVKESSGSKVNYSISPGTEKNSISWTVKAKKNTNSRGDFYLQL